MQLLLFPYRSAVGDVPALGSNSNLLYFNLSVEFLSQNLQVL